MIRVVLFLLVSATALAAAPKDADREWMGRVNATAPGQFPHLRSVKATYRFGWSGIPAAKAEVVFGHPDPARLSLRGKVSTTGAARLLWSLDARLESSVAAATLRPIHSKQTEVYRKHTRETKVTFSPRQVVRQRTLLPNKPDKPQTLKIPDAFDLHAALLYLRSLPLAEGDSASFVVFPGSRPYLATITVQGREPLRVTAGKFPAIRLDLALQRIEKDLSLGSAEKFRSASGWLSDDADRLLLKLVGEVFVGSVFCELAEVEFPKFSF